MDGTGTAGIEDSVSWELAMRFKVSAMFDANTVLAGPFP